MTDRTIPQSSEAPVEQRSTPYPATNATPPDPAQGFDANGSPVVSRSPEEWSHREGRTERRSDDFERGLVSWEEANAKYDTYAGVTVRRLRDLRAHLSAANERAEEFKRIGQQFERDARQHFDQSCRNLEQAERWERSAEDYSQNWEAMKADRDRLAAELESVREELSASDAALARTNEQVKEFSDALREELEFPIGEEPWSTGAAIRVIAEKLAELEQVKRERDVYEAEFGVDHDGHTWRERAESAEKQIDVARAEAEELRKALLSTAPDSAFSPAVVEFRRQCGQMLMAMGWLNPMDAIDLRRRLSEALERSGSTEAGLRLRINDLEATVARLTEALTWLRKKWLSPEAERIIDAALQRPDSEPSIDDRDRGLYRKYQVTRLNDPTGKHRDCSYYVLDLKHDKFADPALRAYADACADEFPELATDLRGLVGQRPASSPCQHNNVLQTLQPRCDDCRERAPWAHEAPTVPPPKPDSEKPACTACHDPAQWVDGKPHPKFQNDPDFAGMRPTGAPGICYRCDARPHALDKEDRDANGDCIACKGSGLCVYCHARPDSDREPTGGEQ